MEQQISWSVPLGRWFRVPVRIHMLLVLLVAVMFALEWHMARHEPVVMGTAAVTAILFLLALLLHEFAHVFALNNLGGQVRCLVLNPWGSNSRWVLPSSTGAQAVVYAAGPLMNLVLFVLGATLLVHSGQAKLLELVNSFRPIPLTAEAWEISALKIFVWANFQLWLVNMIPSFPFDGGQLCRLGIRALHPRVERERIEMAVLVIGQTTAVGLLGIGWLLRGYNVGPIQPTWFVLTCAAIGIFFASRVAFERQLWRRLPREPQPARDDWHAGDMLDDLYDDDLREEEEEEEAFSQWLQQKRELQQHSEREREEDEEQRVDGILAKLYAQGIDSLTDEERSLLQRVSARYRRRRQQQL